MLRTLSSLLKSSKPSLKDIETLTLDQLPFPTLLDGSEFQPSTLKGKVALVVNTASKCGLTDNHYKKLQKLHEQYHTRGLEILGFPCGQFGGQEWDDVCKISDKASSYKVSFTLFSKIDVNGEDTHPIFQWAKFHSGAFKKGDGKLSSIGWNFGKFLVARNGKDVSYFGPNVDPDAMSKKIEELLDVSK